MAQAGESYTTAARHVDADIQPATVRIGPAADNDIVVTDLRAARHHAELRTDADGRRTLVDLGGHSGTDVNGEPIVEADLKSGDIVRIAGVLFRFADGTLTETG